MSQRHSSWLLLCGLFALSSLGAAQPVPLRPPPTHFSSAVLWRGDTELLIPDPRLGQILAFGLDGARRAAFASDEDVPRFLRRPVVLSSGPSGLSLLDSAWQLARLGPHLEFLESVRLPGDRGEHTSTLKLAADRSTILDLPATDFIFYRGAWVLLAEMKDASGWRAGIVEVRPEASAEVRFLLPFSAEEDRFYLYRVNLQRALAATSKGVLALLLHGIPRLVQLLPERRTIALPAPFDTPLPLLPTERFGGSSGYSLLHARLRTLALPVALHVFRDQVYLLTRRPCEGALCWDLWRLGEDAKFRGPLRLRVPRTTQDIVAAPGDSKWALVLKGKLLADGREEVLGVQLLEAGELAALDALN